MTITPVQRRIVLALRDIGPRDGLTLTDQQIHIAARLAAAAATRARPADGPCRIPTGSGPETESTTVRGPGKHGVDEDDLLLLAGIADGLTNDAVAERLRWTRTRTGDRLKALYVLLGVSSRARAVAVGYERGLLRVGREGPVNAPEGPSDALPCIVRENGSPPAPEPLRGLSVTSSVEEAS